MIPVNDFYHIRQGDSFVPFNYPEVEQELRRIKQDISHLHSILKGEIIVSYFKDHCLKREWTEDYPELTELVASRHFKSTHLQSLFDACRNNKKFLACFESYIKKNVFSADQMTTASHDTKRKPPANPPVEPTNNPDYAWRIQKAKLLLHFSHLTENDFHYDYGMKDVMMSNLEAKLGKSRHELNTLLESYVQTTLK